MSNMRGWKRKGTNHVFNALNAKPSLNGGLKPDPTPVQIKYVMSAGLQVHAQAPIIVQTMSNQFA